MGQEHWLTEKQFPLLQSLDAQFFARSGMEDAVSSGILRGRPFGGVSIAWSRDLNHVITPLTKYKHERVVAVKLTTTNADIVFICVYMPFLSSRNRASCITQTIETIAFIESIVEDHPQHSFVLGGDLNTELRGVSPFDPHWNNFSTKNKFAYCRDLFGAPGFTYHHVIVIVIVVIYLS